MPGQVARRRVGQVLRRYAPYAGRAISRVSPYVGAASLAYEHRNAIGGIVRGVYRGAKRAGAWLSGSGNKKQKSMSAPYSGYHGGKSTRSKRVFKGARKNKMLKKAFKYITAPLVWKDEGTKNMTCLQNEAAYHQITHLTNADLLKMGEIAQRQRAAQSAGTLPSAGSTDFQYRNTWLYMQSVLVKYKYTNNCPYPCDIEIYDFKYRRDGSDLIADMMVGGTADINGNKIAAGPALSPSTLSIYPKDFPEVKNKTKIYYKTKQRLAPGEIYEHKQLIVIERLTPSSVTFPNASNTTRNTYLAGYSTGCLIRISGYPNHSKATPGDIGTMRSDLDCVYTRELNFRPMSFYGKHIEYTNSKAAFSDPEFYNNDKGVMQYLDSVTSLLVDNPVET